MSLKVRLMAPALYDDKKYLCFYFYGLIPVQVNEHGLLRASVVFQILFM